MHARECAATDKYATYLRNLDITIAKVAVYSITEYYTELRNEAFAQSDVGLCKASDPLYMGICNYVFMYSCMYSVVALHLHAKTRWALRCIHCRCVARSRVSWPTRTYAMFELLGRKNNFDRSLITDRCQPDLNAYTRLCIYLTCLCIFHIHYIPLPAFRCRLRLTETLGRSFSENQETPLPLS